jgi:uncharacterized membrane protein YfcA
MILLSFAVVMLLAAVSMLRKPKLKDEAEDLNSTASTRSAKTKKLNYPLVGLEGIIVGAFTGFVGAGGGFIIIPALVVLAGLEIKVAIGTSLVIIAVKSLIGFLGDVQSSASVIDWQLLAIFTSISVVGIFLGGILSQKIPSTKLKPGFGWFVLLMGIGMLVKELA